MTNSTQQRHDKYHQLGLWTSERVGWLLPSAAGRWGDREFAYFEGKRYSFNQLNNWSNAAAHELLSLGVKPGDKILLQLANSIELLILKFAAWRIGVVTLPVVPIYRAHEIRAIIAQTHPAVIAVSRTAGSRNLHLEMDEILDADPGYRPLAKIVVGDGEPVPGWLPPTSQPDHAVSDAGLPDPAPAEACCSILFTSGTTSAPKGVQANSLCLFSAVLAWRNALGMSAFDVGMSGAPLTHIGALYTAVLIPLCIGGRTVILPKWAPDEAVDLIEREKVTFMGGATVFLQDMVERYEKGLSKSHRLKIFSSAGAPTPPQLVKRAFEAGITGIQRCYGMTETFGTIAIANMDSDIEHRATTDGKVTFGNEIQIVDDDHREVPAGEIGHIRLRGPQVMPGYTDPVVNAQQIDNEGWFYPGDIGLLTDDGWLKMTGRTKDIINRGGEKFSAQDIEEALAACPEIAKAAVTGVPDARLGEQVAAFLVLSEGCQWSGPEVILAQLEKAKLARQKLPVEWHVMDDFPRTASGKIQKQKLVEHAMQARQA